MTSAGSDPTAGEAMRDRILDAAWERFAVQGVAATTMAQLADAAGISRAWLYRNFANRDAVVRALLVREADRFAADLVKADPVHRPATEAVTDAFVHIVRHLRRHPVLQRVLVTDRDLLAPYLTTESGPVLRLAVDATQAFLEGRTELSSDHARIAADTIVRLLISIATTPTAAVDFDDAGALRAYASRVIPPLLTPAGGC